MTPGWLAEEGLTITFLGPDRHPEHNGTEWVQGTGVLILPTRCQMIESTFTIYSGVTYK